MPPKRKQGHQGQPAAPTKRRKTKKKTGEDNGKNRKTFLDLPPELRNAIYELALVQSDPIKINRRLKEPNLLRTSRQIRTEARPLFYHLNNFHAHVHDCDARLLTSFQRHVMQFQVWENNTVKHDVVISTTTTGAKHWRNLVAWCREIHRWNLAHIEPAQGDGRLRSVVAATHVVAQLGRPMPWARCLQTLEAVRDAVARVDGAWLREV